MKLGLLAACIFLAGCGKPEKSAVLKESIPGPAAAQTFERITAASRVHFIHFAGTNYAMPDQIASGVAVLDFDQDGILDLYFVQNSGPNQLYRGTGGAKFSNVSEGSGANITGAGMSAIAGDVNNDGFVDLVVTEYGTTRILVNRAGKRFEEAPKSCGVENPRWGVAASFIDFNRDGWLDLVVGNYVDYDPSQVCTVPTGGQEFCAPGSFPPTVSRIWKNVTKTPGADPIFEDVTVRSGLAKHPGMALGVVCADFTGDRWPDIFFADDGRPNRLFVNRQNGEFTEEAALRGVAFDAMGRTAANMGTIFADLNGDAKLDLFITHLAEEFHGLYLQQEPGFFADAIAQSGLQQQQWRGTGFGAVAADFNLDGWPDIAIANGLIRRGLAAQKPVAEGVPPWWRDYAQRQQIFLSRKGHFQDVSAENAAFCAEASVGRSLAVGDFDADGRPDLILSSANGPAEIYRNTTSTTGAWIKLRLIDPALGGRDAIGAEARVVAGTQNWRAALQPAASYCASHEPALHFGLGSAPRIDRVEIVWPSGDLEEFSISELNRSVTLKRGEGRRR